jgi:hypothetical protein
MDGATGEKATFRDPCWTVRHDPVGPGIVADMRQQQEASYMRSITDTL